MPSNRNIPKKSARGSGRWGDRPYAKPDPDGKRYILNANGQELFFGLPLTVNISGWETARILYNRAGRMICHAGDADIAAPSVEAKKQGAVDGGCAGCPLADSECNTYIGFLASTDQDLDFVIQASHGNWSDTLADVIFADGDDAPALGRMVFDSRVYPGNGRRGPNKVSPYAWWTVTPEPELEPEDEAEGEQTA